MAPGNYNPSFLEIYGYAKTLILSRSVALEVLSKAYTRKSTPRILVRLGMYSLFMSLTAQIRGRSYREIFIE